MNEQKFLPIFPLPLVLFPEMPLPLHIFEPRYREMVQKCIEEEIEFGVVLADQGKFRFTGTSAKIENILKRFEDGRMDILCLGKRRFHIEELSDERCFLQAQVTFFDDDPEPPSALEELRKEAKALLDEYTCLTDQVLNSAFFDGLTPQTYSFFMAELNSYTLAQQQALLETKSTRQRLFKVIGGIRSLIERTITDRKLQAVCGEGQSFFHILN